MIKNFTPNLKFSVRFSFFPFFVLLIFLPFHFFVFLLMFLFWAKNVCNSQHKRRSGTCLFLATSERASGRPNEPNTKKRRTRNMFCWCLYCSCYCCFWWHVEKSFSLSIKSFDTVSCNKRSTTKNKSNNNKIFNIKIRQETGKKSQINFAGIEIVSFLL